MIVRLDERISNMIAAGEVVTRPASALKEIIENAIDADATKIDIDILDSGLKEIKVTDNGIGMDLSDLKKSFERHATSKIRTEYDLAHIFTLGFRGEAIPAIASVSKMTIKSKKENLDGNLVTYEGGRFVEAKPAALNQGTMVIINDLFYNVPARLKYIKSPQTELANIMEVCDSFILSNPKIAFKVTHEGNVLRQSFGHESYSELFKIVFGGSAANNLLTTSIHQDQIEITAYLGSPDYTKSRKNDIIIILNGRTIKNFLLSNAVVEGYHTRLMTNRYPVAVVDIKMDISLVDVNVHPQKREVKIQNEYQLAAMIRNLIRESFSKSTKNVSTEISSYQQISGFDYLINELELDYKENKTKIYQKSSEKLPSMDYIGQFSGTYLLFQNELGLYLIDQHAAAERIRYEIYYDKLGTKSPVKSLLIPELFEFRPTEETLIKENSEALTNIGITFEAAGHEGLFLKSLPIWLEDEDIHDFIQAILISLEQYKKLDLKDLRDNLSKSIACKGAIKANKALNNHEIQHLIESLRETQNPYYCPHGRPVIVYFSNSHIEHLFKRIV